MEKHKFSLIVPVYNTEKYIEKCLNSILSQSYKNYEIIVINDGSTDDSEKILEQYKTNKKIKIIKQKNKGLSDARNEGLNHISGDYILFIDSDDFIEPKLLETLNNNIEDEDLIRFQTQTVNDNYDIIEKYPEQEFKNLNGKDAFKMLITFNYVENAWLYAYKKDYFISSKYKFISGMYHEDYGLTPLVIIKSNKIKSINYIGYNYLIRTGSIMNNNDYEKTIKKAKDTLAQYKNIVNLDNDIYYKSFLANTVLLKLSTLKGKAYKEYLKEIKKEKVIDNILNDTLIRKIKKLILKINPKLYFKMR